MYQSRTVYKCSGNDYEMETISFHCSHTRKIIAYINCKENTLNLITMKLSPKATERVLKIQEEIKRDYPGYKLETFV